jgi:hypothetical protein
MIVLVSQPNHSPKRLFFLQHLSAPHGINGKLDNSDTCTLPGGLRRGERGDLFYN